MFGEPTFSASLHLTSAQKISSRAKALVSCIHFRPRLWRFGSSCTKLRDCICRGTSGGSVSINHLAWIGWLHGAISHSACCHRPMVVVSLVCWCLVPVRRLTLSRAKSGCGAMVYPDRCCCIIITHSAYMQPDRCVRQSIVTNRRYLQRLEKSSCGYSVSR
jgi:hypothetical protein